MKTVTLALILFSLAACGSPQKRIAMPYASPCSPGAVAVETESFATYKVECKVGEVLEGPSLEVSHQELSLATTTKIRLKTYHEGRLLGRVFERDTQTSDAHDSNFDMQSEWTIGEKNHKIGSEIHSSFLEGNWKEIRHIEWGVDGRLLSIHGPWRTLDFPNGTGPFQLVLGENEGEVQGACFEGLRDGVWTLKRNGEIVTQHSWKHGVADGDFVMNASKTRGTMRDGHRIGTWYEGAPGGECVLSEGGEHQQCTVAIAPVKFVEVYDDEGKLIRRENIEWATREGNDRPRLIADTKPPRIYYLPMGNQDARCDALSDSAGVVNLGMQ